MFEVEDVEVEIDFGDLCVDIFCVLGFGGQGVNIIYLVVCFMYNLIGFVVSCQDECSQIKNKDKVLCVFKSWIFEIEFVKVYSEMDVEWCKMVGSGDCLEKICIYNFLQNCVIDYCIGLMVYKLLMVFEGDFMCFIELLMSYYQVDLMQQIVLMIVG